MTVLLVVAVWAGLALVAALLFIAVMRGGGGTDLPELPPEGAFPTQRAGGETLPAGHRSRRATSV